MEIPSIIYLVLIIFGILQLILFFKLWGMCNDMRELRKFVTMRFSLEAGNARKGTDAEETESIDRQGDMDFNEYTLGAIHYRIADDDKVEIFDSKTGELKFTGILKTYPDYSMCGVWLGKKLYIYKDVESAVKAVIRYGIDGSVEKDNLMEKW